LVQNLGGQGAVGQQMHRTEEPFDEQTIRAFLAPRS